jgi:hypothetical protein
MRCNRKYIENHEQVEFSSFDFVKMLENFVGMKKLVDFDLIYGKGKKVSSD